MVASATENPAVVLSEVSPTADADVLRDRAALAALASPADEDELDAQWFGGRHTLHQRRGAQGRPPARIDQLSEGRLKPVTEDGRSIRDKLHSATRALAAGTGPLKARLRSAFTPELMALRPEDFLWPDLGARWHAVIEELAPNERPIITLEQWWDFELIQIAQEIVDIYGHVAGRHGPG